MSPPPGSQADAGSRAGCPREGPARRWLVDGFNVLHVGILHGRERGRWWEDGARDRLIARLASFDEPEARLEVVFDGPRPEGAGAPGRATVVFAEDADAWLLGEVGRAEDPARLTVVTADRSLADRVRHRGARVVSPKAFLARCG